MPLDRFSPRLTRSCGAADYRFCRMEDQPDRRRISSTQARPFFLADCPQAPIVQSPKHLLARPAFWAKYKQLILMTLVKRIFQYCLAAAFFLAPLRVVPAVGEVEGPQNPRDPVPSLTFRNKLTQLMFIDIDRAVSSQTTLAALIQSVQPGGIVISAAAIEQYHRAAPSREKVKSLVFDIGRYGLIPPFFATNYEGGKKNSLYMLRPDRRPREIGKEYEQCLKREGHVQCSAPVREWASRQALFLRELGFNLNFAPVLDVCDEKFQSWLCALGRGYSSDSGIVKAIGSAYLAGYSNSGVLTTLKHFPGHGKTKNTHNGPVFFEHKPEKLAVELEPFVDNLKAADLVMVNHVIYSSLSTKPASLSAEIVQDMLRDRLQFGGIAVTDSLDMKAVRRYMEAARESPQEIWWAKAAYLAFCAGNDMVILPPLEAREAEEGLAAIERYLSQNPAVAQRLMNQSVPRVLQAKRKINLVKWALTP